VICKHCGTEIADRAIVCYRCGTGTADPVRKPAEIRRRRSPVVLLIVFVMAVLLALYGAWSYGLLGLEITFVPQAQGSAILVDFMFFNA